MLLMEPIGGVSTTRVAANGRAEWGHRVGSHRVGSGLSFGHDLVLTLSTRSRINANNSASVLIELALFALSL